MYSFVSTEFLLINGQFCAFDIMLVSLICVCINKGGNLCKIQYLLLEVLRMRQYKSSVVALDKWVVNIVHIAKLKNWPVWTFNVLKYTCCHHDQLLTNGKRDSVGVCW